MRNRILEELGQQAEAEGFEPGTQPYSNKLLALRVEKCREMQGVPDCPACVAYDNCELIKSYLRLRAFGHT